MCRRESEHHVARRQWQLEQPSREIGGKGLAHCAEDHNHKHHHDNVASLKQHAHIDEHSHTDEEIGNEEGVAYELNAVH